jgi:hypothetical protein
VSFDEINTVFSGVMAIYAILWAIPGVIFGADWVADFIYEN